MKTVELNRISRLLEGHLWVFSNELAISPKIFLPGSLVELRDKKSTFLGIGYVNPNSLISIRILTREKEEIDESFFKRRITDALEYRKRFVKNTNSFRVVYSEGDLLPGLIVDKYDDCLSIQFLTLGMDSLQELIIKVLDDIFSPSAIVVRNDSSARLLEGLTIEKKIVKGNLDKLPIMRDNGLMFEIDPMAGQKTGFFLDQRENRKAFSELVKEKLGTHAKHGSGSRSGLDLFSYTGAWAMHLAAKDASVIGVDDSAEAVKQAERNAELNGLSEKCVFKKANAFDFVKAEASAKKTYDFIALDPPAFVKSKARIKEAIKGYREINSGAMKLLKKNGLLATCSCSYHIDRAAFFDILRGAARDAGRLFRVIETRSQAKDHPALLSVPETAYLKCVIMEVL
ncbi:MAG: class I SAM-dependent rRNA methyltransferase [Thermodesulfobacteriota bacterium]